MTHEEIWQRLEDFLLDIVPVAEEAGVRLMGVNTNMQLMVTGSIMILAVFMHSFHDRISFFKKS